jgi:hypothetical protein
MAEARGNGQGLGFGIRVSAIGVSGSDGIRVVVGVVG